MKKLTFILIATATIFTFTACNSEKENSNENDGPNGSFLKDERDGNKYKTVKIGKQVWMAENLAWAGYNSVGTNEFHCILQSAQRSDYTKTIIPRDSVQNCLPQSFQYSFKEAQNACPAGWHLPSTREFETMLRFVGKTPQERNKSLLDQSLGGTNDYGFSAVSMGTIEHAGFRGLPNGAHFWTSTKDSIEGNRAYGLNISKGEAYLDYDYPEIDYLSVRCIQDSKESLVDDFSIKSRIVKDEDIVDSDGNSYPTVKIGSQIWMAKNLEQKTADSDCFNDSLENCTKYGRLYSWEEALFSCPDGWTLPTSNDYKILLSEMDLLKDGIIYEKKQNAVALRRDESKTHVHLRDESWEKGLNTFGLSMIPSGYLTSGVCMTNKCFFEKDEGIALWTANKNIWFHITKYDAEEWGRGDKAYVRCIKKNPTVLGDSVKDNDGNTYPTVIIGTNLWFAKNMNQKTDNSHCPNNDENLCEKYGRLYQYNEAKTICPSGWHLPTNEDWTNLRNEVNPSEDLFSKTAAIYLKSKNNWKSRYKRENNNGINLFGFNAMPAGMYTSKINKPIDFEWEAYFWSQNDNEFINIQDDYGNRFENHTAKAWIISSTINNRNMDKKLDELSVRCVKAVESAEADGDEEDGDDLECGGEKCNPDYVTEEDDEED